MCLKWQTVVNMDKTKGCGEGSTTGAVAAVACAVADALNQRGGDIHEFPATPERVLKGLGVLP